MAKMHPEQLSNEVRFDPGLSAEVALYDALERSLGEGFEVLHSVAWVAPTEDKRPVKDGEADFVIAHRDHGFLVLEVKGGVIDYDPQENRWTSTSRSGPRCAP